MKLREFLLKACRSRRWIIRNQKGDHANGRRRAALLYILKWLEAHPNAPEAGLAKFIYTNQEKIHLVLPGKGSACGAAMHKQLDEILIEYTDEQITDICQNGIRSGNLYSRTGFGALQTGDTRDRSRHHRRDSFNLPADHQPSTYDTRK